MPSSKLREVTNATSSSQRSSARAKPAARYTEVNESDDDDNEDDAEAEDDEEDAEDDEDEEDAEVDDDDEEDDEDVKMRDVPVPAPLPPKSRPDTTKPLPKVTLRHMPVQYAKIPPKPVLIVTPAGTKALRKAPVKSVEQKEIEMEDDEDDEEGDEDEDEDEELSELNSDEEEEEDEAEEQEEGDETNMVDQDVEDHIEEDVEGEIEENDDEEQDSDDIASGASTPNLAKMTARQRGNFQDEGGFLALPMEPQVKKILTADEHRMRRAEMARRRKNLSEKRNEEEKVRALLPTHRSNTVTNSITDDHYQQVTQKTGPKEARQGSRPCHNRSSSGS